MDKVITYPAIYWQGYKVITYPAIYWQGYKVITYLESWQGYKVITYPAIYLENPTKKHQREAIQYQFQKSRTEPL